MIDKEKNHKIWEALKKTSYEGLHELDVVSENAVQANKDLMKRLLNDNKDTEYGKKYNFAEIHDLDEYRQKVPLTTYEDYHDAIVRMTENGEENILTSYPVVYYASTSGTSGVSKKIPVSDKGLEMFRKYASSVMPSVISEFNKNTKYKDTPDGSRLMIVSFSNDTLKNGKKYGSISAACLNESSIPLMPYFITTPADVMFCTEHLNLKYLYARYGIADRDVVYISGAYIPSLLDLANYICDNWEMLVEDIREGKINNEIQIPDELKDKLEKDLVPDPDRADELEKEFKKGLNNNILARIWPKLSAVCAIWAGNFSSYARKLQQFTGRTIPYYTMSYVSSEGIFGVARHPHDQNYVMLPQSCFFEFIPQSDEEEDNPRTVLIDEVQEGKDYELVITNQSGFYRYRMGDVIRVIGFYNECPMIVFKSRKKNTISVAGEKFNEDHLFSAIQEFERRTGINIIDYCIQPDRSVAPPRYILYLEPDEIVPVERLEECSIVLDEELSRANTDIPHYVAGGNMGKPKLVFLQRYTFQLQRELRMYKMGLSENQMKTIRVLEKPDLIKFFETLKEDY